MCSRLRQGCPQAAASSASCRCATCSPARARKYKQLDTITQTDVGSQQLLVGFMSLYNFYAWPTSVRPRVAQVLVFPPYQVRCRDWCSQAHVCVCVCARSRAHVQVHRISLFVTISCDSPITHVTHNFHDGYRAPALARRCSRRLTAWRASGTRLTSR